MKILNTKIINYWKDLEDEIIVLSGSYGKIYNYNVEIGFYVGLTVLNVYFGLNILNKKEFKMTKKIFELLKTFVKSCVLFLSFIELPTLLILSIYLIYRYPVVGVILILTVGVHLIGKELIKKGKIDDMFICKKQSKDSFVGGENIK